MKTFAIVVLPLVLIGCDVSPHSYGYKDGYSTGFSEKCEINAHAIHGWWNDASYISGFSRGWIDGAEACHKNQYRRKLRIKD